MYSTTDFRNGLKIEIDGDPYVITYFQHVKPGKGSAIVRTKIKSLLTGRVIEKTFRSGDKVGKPDIEEVEGQFLYREGDTFHFMNTANYEQLVFPADILGDTVYFLKDGLVVTLILYNARPMSAEAPTFVNLRVVEAEPGVKGDTASGAQKPVVLETGYKLNVPLFINEGDLLKIDTRDGSYTDRVKE
jgi:elongation factor P